MKNSTPISPSLEDYLEAVLEVADESGAARTTDIADKLGVSKASVNQAMGLLVDRGLIEREKYGPVFLTDSGDEQARAVSKRHHTIKAFLVSVLGVAEHIAEEDACQIEHVVSKDAMNGLVEFMERRDAE